MEYITFTQIHFLSSRKVVEGGRIRNFFKSRARLDIRKYSFSNRIVDKWNSLSENSVNCNTVNTFKKCISMELEP